MNSQGKFKSETATGSMKTLEYRWVEVGQRQGSAARSEGQSEDGYTSVLAFSKMEHELYQLGNCSISLGRLRMF